MDRIQFEINELNTDIINNIFNKNDDSIISEYLTAETIVNIAKFLGLDSNNASVAYIRNKFYESNDTSEKQEQTESSSAGCADVSEIDLAVINNIFSNNDDKTIFSTYTFCKIAEMARSVGLKDDCKLLTSIRNKLYGKYESLASEPTWSGTICGVSVDLHDVADSLQLLITQDEKILDIVTVPKYTSGLHKFYMEDLGSGTDGENVYMSMAVVEDTAGDIPYSFDIWFVVSSTGQIEKFHKNDWDNCKYSDYEVFDPVTNQFTNCRNIPLMES